jgi:hypothetical protein
VVAISGAGASDFAVADDRCTGDTLTVGDTCQIDLRFAPTAAGGRAAQVVVSGTQSTVASAGLRGTGRYAPTIEVLPQVASGGQVVTVTGRGYPASATVNVTLAGSPPQAAATDVNGTFTVQWLILGGTPQGVVEADDVATADYDAAPDELTIVPSPMRPQGTATRVALDRNYVSR